jgi:hypothetical protein
VNFVSSVFPVPFGLIVTRFADAPGMTKSSVPARCHYKN